MKAQAPFRKQAASETKRPSRIVDGYTPQTPFDFAGTGRIRSTEQAAQAAASRKRDADTLERLASQGVDGRASSIEVTVVDLASMGAMTEHRGLPLRRWSVFEAHSGARQRAAGALMAAFIASEGRARQGREIMQIRLRPQGCPVPVDGLRAAHLSETRRLGRMLTYAASRSDIVPLQWFAHHRPVDRGSNIDLHFHIAIDVPTGADLNWLTAYLARAGEIWVGDEVDESLPPEALARYGAAGAARHVDEFDDAALAAYVRQVNSGGSLHRAQSLGPLRRYAADLHRDGLRAEQTIEGVRLLPVQNRSHRRLDAPIFLAGPRILAIRTAWLGEELRPCVFVQGWSDWQSLVERYDLDLAVRAACEALRHTPSKPGIPKPLYGAVANIDPKGHRRHDHDSRSAAPSRDGDSLNRSNGLPTRCSITDRCRHTDGVPGARTAMAKSCPLLPSVSQFRARITVRSTGQIGLR